MTLVHQDHHSKLLWPKWLQQQLFVASKFWKLQVWDQVGIRVSSLSWTWKAIFSETLPLIFRNLGACISITISSAHICIIYSPWLCLVQIFVPFIGGHELCGPFHSIMTSFSLIIYSMTLFTNTILFWVTRENRTSPYALGVDISQTITWRLST